MLILPLMKSRRCLSYCWYSAAVPPAAARVPPPHPLSLSKRSSPCQIPGMRDRMSAPHRTVNMKEQEQAAGTLCLNILYGFPHEGGASDVAHPSCRGKGKTGQNAKINGTRSTVTRVGHVSYPAMSCHVISAINTRFGVKHLQLDWQAGCHVKPNATNNDVAFDQIFHPLYAAPSTSTSNV